MRKISIKTMMFLVFLYSLAANFAHPVTPTFIKVLGLHDYMFGLAFACMSATNFLFAPFWGKISEKYGGALIFCACMLGYGIMQVFFGLSKSELAICIARLIGGFFISGISVSDMIYIIRHSEHSGKDLAVAGPVNAVTAPFGFLIGGFLGDVSILMTFIIQGVTLFLIGILGFLIMGDSSNKEEVSFNKGDMNPFKSFANASEIVTGFIAVFLVISCVATFSSTCYEQCFNYYIKDVYGFPSSYNGILKALVGFIALFVNWRITMRLIEGNAFKSIVPVFGLLFAMMIGVVTIDNMIPFIIINVVFFGCNSIYLPLLQNMMTKYNADKQGELVGLFTSLRSLGNVFGSLLAGFIYSSGPKNSFVVAMAGFGVCVILSYFHYRKSLKELVH